MKTLMEGWGCRVLTAQDKTSLMELLKTETSPALLIADYHLDDDENGLDAAIAFNQALAEPIPVLMITANYSAN